MARFVLRVLAPAALVLALATPQASSAQGKGSYGGWSYEWALGIGDLEAYIANDSWVGFTLQGRSFVSEHFAVGGFIGYNVFYENTSDVIELPRGAVSGQQYRHLSTVPIMVGLYRHLGGGGRGGAPGTHLYLGINGGVYYFYQMMDIGVFTLSTSEWLFGVAPEVGIVMTRGRTAVALQVKYHYPVPGGEGFLSGQERSFQYVSVGLGFFARRGY